MCKGSCVEGQYQGGCEGVLEMHLYVGSVEYTHAPSPLPPPFTPPPTPVGDAPIR